MFFVVLLKFGMKVMHNLRHFYSFTLRPFHSKKQMFVEEASFSSTKAMRKVKTVLIYTFGKSTLHTPRLKFIPSDIVRCCLDSSRRTTLNGGFSRLTTKNQIYITISTFMSVCPSIPFPSHFQFLQLHITKCHK